MDIDARLTPEDERLAGDLAKLEAKVKAQLWDMRGVTAALTDKLGLGCARGDVAAMVAHALVHYRTGEEIVVAFNAVDEALKDDAARVRERRALKSLTWQVLPFATDWRTLLLRGRAALAGGAGFVNLPFSRLTMAEVVLAGIDCRSCHYNAEGAQGGMPSGNAVVRLPVIADGLFIDHDGQRLAEATVGHLAVTLLGLAPDDARLRRNDPRLRREVNEVLQYYCEALGDDRLPRYFLLDDENFREVGGSNAGTERDRLVVAITALGNALPQLRFLRLGDGVAGEVVLALHIGRMWRKGI